MTEIILKQGVGEPSDSSVEVAELAIDSTTGDLYSKLTDGTVKQLNAGGDGAGMVISETEPDESDRFVGLQWLDIGGDEPHVWVWDDTAGWVELPAGGYDDTEVKGLITDNTAAIGTKLDADTIWTGTQAEYDALTPDADTLYFIV